MFGIKICYETNVDKICALYVLTLENVKWEFETEGELASVRETSLKSGVSMKFSGEFYWGLRLKTNFKQKSVKN